MTHELDGLRRDVRRHGGARGKRYSPELRRRLMGYAERRRQEGASWMTIASELGACFETVRRWCRAGESSARVLRRVELVAEPALPTEVGSSPLVVTPNGLRIEGAGLDAIIALVRALG